jgi:Flp pilus assembly pilin Flp
MSSRILVVKTLRDRSGATMVEYALALPLLLVLIFGALDMAWAAYQWNAAAKATQWGARWAVVNPPMSATFAASLNASGYMLPDELGKSCIEANSDCSADLDEKECTVSDADCNMTAVLDIMRGVFLPLQDENVRVIYEPYPDGQQLGFVGRPGGAPVRVTVDLTCQPFNWFFIAGWFGWAMPALPADCGGGTGIAIPARYSLSSESFGRP